jgi:hypothetical protein
MGDLELRHPGTAGLQAPLRILFFLERTVTSKRTYEYDYLESIHDDIMKES